MRILYVVLSPVLSTADGIGYATHINGLVGALRQLGCEVETVIVGDVRRQRRGDNPPMKSALRRLIPEPLRAILRDLFLLWHDRTQEKKLAAVAARYRPDIIYERSTRLQTSGARVAKRLDIPLVLEINGPSVEKGGHFRRPLQLIDHHLVKYKARTASAVITISEALRVQLAVDLGIDDRRIHALHNGVDERWIRETQAPAARQAGGTAADFLTVGFVGSFAPWHGMDLLIHAFYLARKAQGNLKLMLIGDGPMREQAERLAKHHGIEDHVTFTGRVPRAEVARLLTEIEIAVLPNNAWYGSPTKLFEYGAAAKAVVAPRTPAIAEVMEHQVTGLLVTPGNVAELAQGLILLAQDPGLRSRLGTNWRGKVLREHTWVRVARETLAICRGVLARR